MNDLFSVKDKVIIVTGASKGIGKTVAEALVESGAIVYGIGTSFENKSEGNFNQMKCDITNHEGFKKICDSIFNFDGRIDGMVNNAGVTYTGNENEPYPEYLWDKTMEINLKSVFKNTQYVCELMYKNGTGSVVNLTSLNASFGFPNNPAYQASKGGLRMLTKSFARDWGRKGLRFNNIVPGLMVTRLTQASHDNPVTHTQRRQNMMLGRWGQPEDIVGPCIFLLSNASSYMTGQDIYVDGGWSANGLPFLD